MVNVIPSNDEREHDHSANCWCEPRVEWIDPETGFPYPNGPGIYHNAADCREFSEEITGESVSEGKFWTVYDDDDEIR
jgi:hypothetical protein